MPILHVPSRVRFALETLRGREYVFLMSHMRSYSTLLSHILSSNDELSGYVETHQSYDTELDLLRLRARVRETLAGDRRLGRCLVDKLLHDRYVLAPSVLERDDVKLVFMVREPVRTIQSIMAMGMAQRKRRLSQGKTYDWRLDPQRVVDYYVRRLDGLVDTAGKKPKGSAFFDADRLIEDTDRLLEALTSFLRLRCPLTMSYRTYDLTGMAKLGDPSRFIRAGTIVRDRDEYAIEVPPPVLDQADRAYRGAVARLSSLVEVSL